MEFDKRDMTLEEATEIIKEIEPMHEQTNSGRAESLILQAVHCADVFPAVHGEWIGEIAFEQMEISMQECNVCHKIRPIDNFCGNCGADMRQRRE